MKLWRKNSILTYHRLSMSVNTGQSLVRRNIVRSAERTLSQRILRKWIIHSSWRQEESLWQRLSDRDTKACAYKTQQAAPSHSRCCPFLILLIKNAFVPICPEEQSGNPRRCPSHLVADRLQGNLFAGFDDELIMDVTADEAVGQRPHGVGEDIPAYCLDDVLHELRAVAFDVAPLFLRIYAHAGNAFAAEAVSPDARLHIGKPPAGRQRDEQHPTPHGELDSSYLLQGALTDRRLDGVIGRNGT